MIFILDKQEKVINTLKNSGYTTNANPFYNDTHTEILSSGAETFTFTTLAQGSLSKDLSVGNFVAFKKDGKYKLFQIMQVTETHAQEMEVTVYCECAGLSLINKVFRARKLTSASLKTFLTTVLEDTDWNVGLIEMTSLTSQDLDLEDASVYATLQNNISKYNVEIEFRVEINNGQISKKFIDTYAHRGKVAGKRFVFGKDIESITKTVDSTELFTALIGRGKNGIGFKDVQVQGIDKPLGQDFVADQEAYELYNNNGYHLMGLYEVDSESPEEVLRKTYKRLQEVKEPKVTYEIPVVLLGHLLDRDWDRVRIGDYIGICDQTFNPPLTLMARVSQLDTSFSNPYANKCTLTNFVEVSSNISDEMRKMASELKDYVSNTVSDKFPIGSEDIQNGAVKGEHIYQSSVTTEHLQAGSVTAEKIDTEYINAVNGKFDKLTAKDAEIEKLVADNIEAVNGKFEHLEAEDARIEQLTAGKATIENLEAVDAKITQLKADVAYVKDLEATNAKVEKLEATDAEIKNLVAEKANIGDLNATNIKVENLEAETAKIGKIESDLVETKKLVADKANIKDLEAVKIKAEKVESDLVETNKLVADKATIGDLNATNANIQKLQAKDAEIDRLLAGNITAGNIQAGSITGDRIKAGTITANNIKAGTITAESGILGTAAIKTANIADAQITGAKIANGAIGNAQITDAAISGAKIANAAITNAKIADATIEAAKIKSINASTINTGTLDARNIKVINLNADSITTGAITVLGENLIHNSSFKTQTYWSGFGSWVIDETDKFEGINSAKISRSGLTSFTWAEFRAEPIQVTEGQAFVGSVYFKSSNTTSDSDYCIFALWGYKKDGTRVDLSSLVVRENISSYKRFILTGIVPKDVETLRLSFSASRNGTFNIAKPMLSKGSIASIWKEHNDELISNGAINTDKIGENAVTASKLNLEDLFVSNGAFIQNLQAVEFSAEQITTGKIDSERLDITGLVGFEAFDKNTQWVFDTSGDKTFINGGAIYTNSVTADKINAKGLTVTDSANMTTFKIDDNGEVYVTGNIQSSNYDEVDQTGYKITKDGDAIFNNALVRGDVILPNAGITNFGGTIGNANLIPNSQINETSNAYGFGIRKLLVPLKSNTTYTFTVNGRSNPNGNPEEKQLQCYVYETTWNYGSWSFPIKEEKDTTKSITFTTGNIPDGKVFQVSFYWYPNEGNRTGNATVNWCKLEEGNKSTSWCPAVTDKLNPIRFWAGANYDNRNNAPFRVYQDGSIYATKGNFEGTFSGRVDIGNIHISDTNSSQAEFRINTNNDSETKIFLSETNSFINTNMVFGTIDHKQIEFDVVNRKLNAFDTTVRVNRTNNGWVEIGGTSTSYSPFSIGLNKGTYGDYRHDFGFSGGGLVFNNAGARGADVSDYVFKKKNGAERVKVEIDGTLDVDDDIVLGVMKIAKRTDSGNEGVDFII